MIRSTVIVEGYKVDLLEDVSADFTYSIQDIREPDKRSTDFSKTIDLPGTPRNNALFAQIWNINTENDYDPSQPNIGYNFNPNKAVKCLVLVDNIEVFRGIIRIAEISLEKDIIKYSTNVIGRLADILLALGDSKLSDLDFSDLNHTLTTSYITNSWYAPRGTGYVYPLIDYGFTLDGINYPITAFKPAIYALEYINRMFAAAGFTYNCPFFAQPYFKSLIIPCTEKKDFNMTAVQAKFLECYSRELYTVNRRTGGWRERNNWWGEPFGPKLDLYNFITISNDEDVGNKLVITRNITTSFQFTLKFIVKNDGSYMNIRKNGEVIANAHLGEYRDAPHEEVIEIPKQDWVIGDVLTMSMDMPPRNVTTFFKESKVVAPSPNDTNPYPIDNGAPVVMDDFVSSSIAQKDFFKSIILMHNLYVFTDQDNDKNLIIIPQTWFYDTYAGNAVDWTYKVDYGEEIKITPMGQLTFKEFLFTYAKDTDYYNDDKYYKKYNEVFGQKKFVADNEFQKESTKIELVFSPTPSVQIPSISMRAIPHIYKVDSDGVKQSDTFNIRILQYGGLKYSYKSNGSTGPLYAPWSMIDSNKQVLESFIEYPYAGMTDDIDKPFIDLSFGPSRELFYAAPNPFPDVGLFKYYWEDYINEITNKDSKLWEAYLLLSPTDISRLDFKKLVKIDNTYFKLNKVSQYNPLKSGLTRVELFKTAVVVETVRPGFLLHEDGGYIISDDDAPARIPYA